MLKESAHSAAASSKRVYFMEKINGSRVHDPGGVWGGAPRFLLKNMIGGDPTKKRKKSALKVAIERILHF
jgi:hypothetical protein